MQKTKIRLLYKYVALFLVVALIVGGVFWWQYSDKVTFQEYKPAYNTSGFYISDAHVEVYTARAHKGFKLSKYLILNLALNAILTESDESVYAKRYLSCNGYITDCYTLQDKNNNTIVIVVERPATNLPATGQSIQSIIGRTLLRLHYQSNNLMTDKDIKSFFNSLQPYKFSNIPVFQK
jgi:hypothetical protein